MAWKIEFRPQAGKMLEKLDVTVQKRIRAYLKEKVAALPDPRTLGKALQGPLKGLWRYRVGDYRIICRIEDDRLVVLVVAVGHRKDVYQ